MNNISLSFIKLLKDNIESYVYYLPRTAMTDLEVNVTADTLSTDTTFTLTGNIDSSIDKEFMVGRYIKFNDTYIRIVDYDSLTGLVTIKEPFGVVITTTDSLYIAVKDNVFVDIINNTPMENSQVDYGIIYNLLAIIYVQNTLDFDKAKTNKIINDINKLCIKTNRMNIKVYDFDSSSPTYGNEISNAQITNYPTFEDISILKSKDIATGYVEYRAVFNIRYKYKF